ncbi:MAG: hypothetical protein H6739_38435 [Alphaproteobacteria bacterium]|nr:hypothetical protein [Alphaproteobacteria bacterium]
MLLLPALLLSLAPDAAAQAVTAYAAFPYAGEPSGRHAVAVSETDLVIVRQDSDESVVIERYGEDLSLIWSAPVVLPDVTRTWLGDGGFRELFGVGDNFLYWPDRALLVEGDQVALVSAYEQGVRAWRVDLETGAFLGDESLLVTAHRPGLYLSEDRQRVAAFWGGDRGEPMQAQVWDAGLETTWAVEIPHFEAGVQTRIDVAGRRIEEVRVRFAMDDAGNLYMAANPEERQIVVRQLRPDGQTRTLVADLGDGTLATVGLTFGPSGQAWVVGVARTTKLLRETHAGVTVAALDFEEQRVRWTALVSPDRFRAAYANQGQPIAEASLDWHAPVALLELPDGGAVLVTQYQALKTSTTSNTTSATLDFQDLAVYRFDQAGGLAWTSGVSLTQTVPAGVGNPQVGQHYWLTDDALRMVQMEVRSKLLGAERFVGLREVSLADGAASAPVELAALPSKYDVFFEDLTVVLSDDVIVLASRIGAEEDMGLLSQVELGAPPPPKVPLIPAVNPDRTSPDYRAGQIVGGQAALGAPRNALVGFAKGAPMGFGGMVGGALLSPLSPATCVAGPAAGCVGGALLAGFATQASAEAPLGDFSPEFQAGWIDGYRRYARRKQVRWAILGAGAGAVVAFVPATVIATIAAAP